MMTALLSRTKPVDAYKYQKEREIIRDKTRLVGASARLIEKMIDNLGSILEEELRRAQKEAAENKTFLSDFHEELLSWDADLMTVITALRGMQTESDEIDNKLCQILFYVKRETGLELNHIQRED